MSLEEATSTMPFYQALWKKIDDNMEFPEEIARNRIAGQVVIHARVDHKGLIVGDFQKVTADHKILRTLALIHFYRSLKTPLPMRLWRKDQKIISMVFTFDFKVLPFHGFDSEDHGGYFKNALLFRRIRYIDPKLYEDINYVLTTWVPPIIPFPGGIYVDFIRAYQMIDNYLNERPDYYVQKERQYQMFGEKLNSTLMKEKPKDAAP